MAKQVSVTLEDLLNAVNQGSERLVSEASTKVKKFNQKDVNKIGDRFFTNAAEFKRLDEAEAGIVENVQAAKKAVQEKLRLDAATLFASIAPAVRTDRTEEGIDKFKEEMEKRRYALYLSKYPEDKLPETAMMKTGKEQSLKKKDAKDGRPVKFGSWVETYRDYNVVSKLIGQISRFGWDEVIGKDGRPVEHAIAQKWSVDDSGELVKENGTQSRKAGMTPKEAAEKAIETLKTRLKAYALEAGSNDNDVNALFLRVALEIPQVKANVAVAEAKAAKKAEKAESK